MELNWPRAQKGEVARDCNREKLEILHVIKWYKRNIDFWYLDTFYTGSTCGLKMSFTGMHVKRGLRKQHKDSSQRISYINKKKKKRTESTVQRNVSDGNKTTTQNCLWD